MSRLPTTFDADQRYPVDLHMHSTASDGALSPTELVALCAARGLTHMSLTDHDTMDGIDEAAHAAQHAHAAGAERKKILRRNR